MAITAEGFCKDCDETVEIDFDEESGAPFCLQCGSYEVEDVETFEDDEDEEDEFFDDEYAELDLDDD